MAKRIAIATVGTQGDVQPYLALAVALQRRGYSVVLGAPDDFEDLITRYGVEFRSLGGSMQQFLTQTRFENAMSQSLLINGPSLLRQGQMIVDTAARLSWEMAQGADAIKFAGWERLHAEYAKQFGVAVVNWPPKAAQEQ